MSDIIISVEKLGKKYKIEHQVTRKRQTTLRDAITAKAQGLFQRSKAASGSEDPDQLSAHSKSEEFWALKDVSFEVKRGEVLGIIGRNGAGKSTLLKILSRITEPTEGRVRLNGRVASLLEVGTGFHPELTGRENVFLNGAILGMSKAEIRRKFDEIVAFAGVERFLDTPVKRYSSGMYVRLAFAVAANLEPEILIVDEVLAVGDAEFQKKCLGKMQDVSTKEGRTVLFVSHSMATISNLCNRGIFLQQGRNVMDGLMSDVISHYINVGKDYSAAVRWSSTDRKAPGNEKVRLLAVEIHQRGLAVSEVSIDEAIAVIVEFENFKDGAYLTPNLHLIDKMNVEVLSAVNWRAANLIDDPLSEQPLSRGRYRAICEFPANFFNDGLYTFNVFVLNERCEPEVSAREVVSFVAHDTGAMRRNGYTGNWLGIMRPKLAWTTQPID